MDTFAFLEAVRSKDTDGLEPSEKHLADTLLAALGQASGEFHADVLSVLGAIEEKHDMTELIETICSVSSRQRTQLLAFVTTGEATDAFARDLNADARLQRAVAIALAGHLRQLPDLGQALDAAKEYLDRSDEEGDAH